MTGINETSRKTKRIVRLQDGDKLVEFTVNLFHYYVMQCINAKT